MSRDLSILINACESYNITLDEKQQEQFISYYDHLVQTNGHMNLTAITEWDEVLIKHYIDSISLLGYLNSNDNKSGIGSDFKNISLLDLGSGAGFPGIPLKITCPSLNIVLADSLNKRVNFLNEVISILGLKDISAIHGRAEELARQKDMRESFDIVVSRAVANAAVLSEYCLPFVKLGGYLISYKTDSVLKEEAEARKAIKVLGGITEDVYQFTLPGTDIARSFLIIKKEKRTPKEYPRKAGNPSKNPIK